MTEAIKAWPFQAMNNVASLFDQFVYDRGAMSPESWVRALVVLLPQGVVWSMCKGSGPINLLAVTQKLFLRILHRLMGTWVAPRQPCIMGWGFGPPSNHRSSQEA